MRPSVELSDFSPASLDLVAERTLLDRTESKFAIGLTDLGRLLSAIREEYAVLQVRDSPMAQYRTLYYDSHDQRLLDDHRRGRRPRQKVRIRHYVERDVSYLEVKSKTPADRTQKFRLRRASLTAELSDSERHFIGSHCPLDPSELSPALWTTYRRIALLGIHHPERVTIDFDLTFERHGVGDRVGGLAFVEVKQARFQARSPVFLGLRRGGARKVAFSKYCVGASRLTGYKHRHRFLLQFYRARRLVDG